MSLAHFTNPTEPHPGRRLTPLSSPDPATLVLRRLRANVTLTNAEAELVTAGPKHAVAKGETLTSIARQYNIPLAELKNANKIDNERKLQIGQILTIPTAITPAPSDKKENP